MEQIIIVVQSMITLIGILIGGWDGLIYTLILFISIEYLTNIAVEINKKRLLKGLIKKTIKKTLIIFLVSMGYFLDFYVFQSNNLIRTAVIFFYISIEGLSIVKNMEMLGIPIPQKIKKFLKILKNE